MSRTDPAPITGDDAAVGLRYVAVVSPIMVDPKSAPGGFAPKLVDGDHETDVNVGLRGNLALLSDQQLVQVAEAMNDRFETGPAFPIGLFAGLDAALRRWPNRAASGRSRIVVDLIMPESDAYIDAVATLVRLVAPRRLGLDAGLVELHRRRLAGFEKFVGVSPADAAATLGDSGVLRRWNDETLVVDGLMGDWAFRAPLLKLAADASVPCVVAKLNAKAGSVAVTWDTGAPLETSALLAQVALGLQPPGPADRRVHGEHYLIKPTEPRRPTRGALDRLEAVRWNVGGTYSPTAQVLLAHPGGLALGEELKQLVLRWLDLRIFDGSLVTEMVLHDQSHALSVDRNVAIIAGALLDDGKLSVAEVFRLGCAAWLHDCGHSSARVQSGGFDAIPIEPGFVRKFHGALGARRIGARTKELGLDDEHAGWVRLLARHHQGWTSAGGFDDQPTPKQRTDEEDAFAGELTCTLAESLDELCPADGDLEQAIRLVAVLRVCDAVDIGRHRVSHGEWHKTQLDEFVRIYTRRCIDAIDQGEATAEVIERLGEAQRLASRQLDGTVDAAGRFKATQALIKGSLATLDPGMDHRDRVRITTWTDRVLAYYEYLFDQAEHFALHGSINTVIPLVAGAAGERSLQLLVIPAELDEHGQNKAAVEQVRGFLERELGLVLDEGPDPGLPFFAKEPVRRAFAELGLPLVSDVTLSADVSVPAWWRAYRDPDPEQPRVVGPRSEREKGW